MATASCVPATLRHVPPTNVAPVVIAPADPASPYRAEPEIGASLAPAPYAFIGRTALDRLRALDCLAQAIYYEAATESEDGQRAVAQVVLNRVRHPAWPNSVCGVVYQGPMRAGGGCQFTFTCDGSLALRPAPEAWARARLLAAEALAGRIYAPVGQSTHYHSHAVFPTWAPALRRTIVIGAHNFYRLPELWGGGAAFDAAYSGREPLPRPTMTMLRPRPADTLPALAASRPAIARAAPLPASPPADPPWQSASRADSNVREEYRHSGQWRPDAPAAIVGR